MQTPARLPGHARGACLRWVSRLPVSGDEAEMHGGKAAFNFFTPKILLQSLDFVGYLQALVS